jgi:hypothetical protein
MRRLKEILTGALTLIDYSATNCGQVQKKTLPYIGTQQKQKHSVPPNH